MEQLFKKAVLSLMSEKCYTEFFVKFNFLNILCGKALVSKLLGLVIIAGSSIVKVPQILKIWNSHSAKGMNIVNVLTDLYAITVGTSYGVVKGFPFSAFGEGLFLGLQTMTIAAQVLFYSVSSIAAAAFIAVYSVICYSSVTFIPINILWNLQATSIPILFFGKLAQAYTNFKNKSTGQLSAATCTMLLVGSVSRIFTSIQETGDNIIILTYLLATIGNGIIVFQFLFYRKPAKPAPKPKKKKDSKKIQ